LLADGARGTVWRFESRFEWWKPDRGSSWKTETPAAAGGGILYDLGTHVIDQAIRLFGDATPAHRAISADGARGSTITKDPNIERHAEVVQRLGNGSLH